MRTVGERKVVTADTATKSSTTMCSAPRMHQTSCQQLLHDESEVAIVLGMPKRIGKSGNVGNVLADTCVCDAAEDRSRERHVAQAI